MTTCAGAFGEYAAKRRTAGMSRVCRCCNVSEGPQGQTISMPSTELEVWCDACETARNTKYRLDHLMPELTTLLLFLSASFVLLVVPGPTIALIISKSVAQGRKVALPMIAGIAMGGVVAATLALAGVSALLLASSGRSMFSRSPVLFICSILVSSF